VPGQVIGWAAAARTARTGPFRARTGHVPFFPFFPVFPVAEEPKVELLQIRGIMVPAPCAIGFTSEQLTHEGRLSKVPAKLTCLQGQTPDARQALAGFFELRLAAVY
jgi:hypothetical protein